MRVFKEVEPDVVEHTSASKLLVENEYMGDYVGAICEEVWPAALKVRRFRGLPFFEQSC